MAFFKRLKWLFKGNTANEGVITPEMREKALETRRLNAKLEQMQKQIDAAAQLKYLSGQIQNMNEESGGTSKTEEMLLSMLMSAFMNPKSKSPSEYQSVLGSPLPNTPDNSDANKAIAEQLKKKIPADYLAQVKICLTRTYYK